MRKTRLNPRLAKIHYSYTIEEVAELYSVHRNTVRMWIKAGLPAIDRRRPVLILGSALRAFLTHRRQRNKRSCGPAEFYCLRCREPRAAAGGLASYRPMTLTGGNLIASCSTCNTGLYRRVSVAKLGAMQGLLRVTLPQGWDHIGESHEPSLNSDFKQEATTHANTPR